MNYPTHGRHLYQARFMPIVLFFSFLVALFFSFMLFLSDILPLPLDPLLAMGAIEGGYSIEGTVEGATEREGDVDREGAVDGASEQ